MFAMKPRFFAIVLGLALPASAQDKAPVHAATDLPHFRAAFARLEATEPTVAIACVRGGEPVILVAGKDARGKEVDRRSLLPLFGLGKVLVADAIHCQLMGKIDQGSGEKLGGRELTFRELLDGTPLLPDCFVLDNSGSVDAAVLRECGRMAVAGGLRFQLGHVLAAAEFVLLEPSMLGQRHQDWPSMVRATLSPRVPGLNPVDAGALPEEVRARSVLPAEGLASLATARPAVLRLMLSVTDLATWWQWRLQQDAPVWASRRMARLLPPVARPMEQRWLTPGIVQGHAYPAQKASLLWFGPSSLSSLNNPVVRAFEEDLFTDVANEAAVAVPRVAAVDTEVAVSPNGEMLAGTRWRSAPGANGTSAFQLAFGKEAEDPLVLTLGSEVASLFPTRDGVEWWTDSDDERTHRGLWLWPQPDVTKPVKLGVMLMTKRTTGPIGERGAYMTASVPQYLELVPAPK